MASARLRKKQVEEEDRFLSEEKSRTIKPADFKNHMKLHDLSQEELIELLCLMEAELQAKDILLKAILSGEVGTALPLSHLLNDVENAELPNKVPSSTADDDEEVWLGEPSAHLTHVVAYHQVVREQMQSIVTALEKQHKQILHQLREEQQKHALDRAQGDDVTYMLEKERERLQLQIDKEQMKFGDLQQECSALMKLVESERREQYNTFNSLMSDCKSFAQEFVQLTTKYEQSVKEIDKEKQKNKVLSELMVKETQRLKEKLKSYENEVNDFHVLEQKRMDLEAKLTNSERNSKETFHQLNEERVKNNKLQYQLNQMKKLLPTSECEDTNKNDVLLYQNQVEIPVKQAAAIQLSQDSHDNRSTTRMVVNHGRTVRSSKLENKMKVDSTLHNNSSRKENFYSENPKRHSYEDRLTAKDTHTSYETMKRNSYESISHHTYYTGSASNQLHMGENSNSYDEVHNLGQSRIPPPAPPRRVSSLNEKTPIVKVPMQLQPRKSVSLVQSRASTDFVYLPLKVICDYGWQYCKDSSFEESHDLLDLVSVIQVPYSTSWPQLTMLINNELENIQSGYTSSAVQHYELGVVQWSGRAFPSYNLTNVLLEVDSSTDLSIKLKFKERSLINLSYLSMMPLQFLEECLRIASKGSRVMFNVTREIEGRHFIDCLVYWLLQQQDSDDCCVLKVDEGHLQDVNAIREMFVEQGLLGYNQTEALQRKFVLVLNFDWIYRQDLGVYDWLNSTELVNQNRWSEQRLHRDVTVLAYSTDNNLSQSHQATYRLFKIMSLPWKLPCLLRRLLRQQICHVNACLIDERQILGTIDWLASMFSKLRENLMTIDLANQSPGVMEYLRAPLDNVQHVQRWFQQFWVEQIVTLVRQSVEHRTKSATSNQRQMLVRATLKALFESSVRPQCLLDLHVDIT